MNYMQCDHGSWAIPLPATSNVGFCFGQTPVTSWYAVVVLYDANF